MRAFVIVLGLVSATLAFPAAEEAQKESSYLEDGLEGAYRFLKDCGDKEIFLCMKMRALTFVDRALRKPEISILEGVSLVKNENDQESVRSLGARALSESELDNTLPQNEEEKDSQVENLLVDRVARFLSSHTLQVKVPDSSISEMRRSLDEARGKKKKLKMLLPLLLLLKLKAAALIPLALGGLALLALKALIVSKLALVLAAIIALQKLLHKGHSSSYEVVAHPVHHEEHDHGHYGRSIQDPQDLAYRAQKPE